MTIYFPDTILQRYTYTDDKKGVYGETIQSYEYKEDILVDFQNENNNELAQQYGVDLQNLYKIYGDEETNINDNDQLRDNQGNKYHIIGKVRHYTHFHKYWKANLIKER